MDRKRKEEGGGGYQIQNIALLKYIYFIDVKISFILFCLCICIPFFLICEFFHSQSAYVQYVCNAIL